MALNTCYHAVIIRIDTAIQRIILSNSGFDCIFTACAYMIKVCVSFADNSFPNKELCSCGMSHLISIGCILRSPRRRDITLITILHDTAEQKLNRVRLNGVVQVAGVVIPEVFIKLCIGVSYISNNTGFNTIANLSVIGIHAMER